MTDPKRAEHVARETILKLLSNEEIARVSTAEGASRLTDGEEYLDLEHLDQGIQRAQDATKVKMGHILSRSAVRDETWRKIRAQLAAGTSTNQVKPLAGVPETLAGAGRRLFDDRGFVIHCAAYLAVNALLIVINLVTTPATYWFYWPLLGWGLGVRRARLWRAASPGKFILRAPHIKKFWRKSCSARANNTPGSEISDRGVQNTLTSRTVSTGRKIRLIQRTSQPTYHGSGPLDAMRLQLAHLGHR